MNVQKAVRQETIRMIQGTVLCSCVLFVLFWAGHYFFPDYVPMDYRVVLGLLAGSAVAIANFFLLALTVQKAAELGDEKAVRRLVQASYTRRMLLQGAWVVGSLLLPCFNWVAAVLPLTFPRTTIYLLQITGQFRSDEKEGES